MNSLTNKLSMPTQRNPRDDPTWYDAAVLDEIMTIDCRLGVVNGDNATAELSGRVAKRLVGNVICDSKTMRRIILDDSP
eukprot:scaffold442_cov109-Skeletonema_dohrnii-CCMP3373.AAC.2